MARTEVTTRTLYSFDELSDDAKDRARDWHRGCIDADEIANDGDDWDTIAGILGVEFATRAVQLMGGGTRHENRIYWELDPTGCAFDGSYAYAKGAPKAIRAHAPLDRELHRIADELQRVQRRAFYRLTATCKAGGYSGTSLEVRHDGDNPSANAWKDEARVEELLNDFAAWIGRQIEAQRDYLYSEESVDETIRCNDYEFDEDGRIA